ncbi:MAG: NAD-dependent deacylase [Deltaproteobacteria bacterium]|nr:NAD-dependent deacylase [Deltaproteobacteria bacterium]MBW2074929.1 NAD-dependent deacylase [Deltaproteobacteria bacterium]RLB80590.1 MAG: NAD-dependent deacylase [Deltaproteobacteria bacterium]
MNTWAIRQVAEKIKASTRVVVLTGAGISQESGVPTFRGADGLWKNFRAEDLATPEAFDRDPLLVWQWYDWRRSLIKLLKPNAGHYALVELEKKAEDFTLITQNVDGLHKAAGSRNPIEMHGTLWRVRCLQCKKSFENKEVPIQIPPKCTTCGGLLRPDVVWFGEALDEKILHAIYTCLQRVEVMLIVGTSAIVQPAASFGLVAKRAGAFVTELNRSRTAQSSLFDCSIQGKAGELLPQLVEHIGP